MEIFGYIALIAIGMVLALIGGGGSLLSVPILVYIFSLDVVTASSYSLFIVGTTSLFGAWLKQKDQRVDMRSGFIFIACSVIAIFSSRRWIVPSIPDEVFFFDNISITKRALILGLFALLAITSSLAILLKRNHNNTPVEGSRLSLLVPVGFSTGILVGLVGAGGGFIILPSLSFFARLPFKIALGTTLMVIGMNSLLGFVGDVMNYEINWTFLLLITALAVTGMLIGDIFSRRIPVQRLRESFGWFMLTMALAILVTEFVL
ncbi:MAG TPA: sulfite exporter TauE/SafE family protein [Chryseolinea sp.]